MKLLATLFTLLLIGAIVVVATMVQLLIWLAPYLVLVLIVSLVLQGRQRGGHPAPSVETLPPVAAAPMRQYRIGAPAAAPEGWAMVPVWVAPPRPGPPVIDAEVISGRD